MQKSRRERGLDDLLLDGHTALTDNPHADTLARAVTENWETALIDEFQDPDPLQYEIFQKICIAQNRPLFLVGDPKQAVTAFAEQTLRLPSRGGRRAAPLHALQQLPQPRRAYRQHRRAVPPQRTPVRFGKHRQFGSRCGACRKQAVPERPAVQVR